MAENDPNVTAPEDVEVPAEVNEPEVEMDEGTKTLTQEEVDAIISKRLREADAKYQRDLAQYQQELARRDAFIQGLQQNAVPHKEADPYEGLNDDEKMLARATSAANKPLQKQFSDFTQQLASLVAPILVKEQMEEFFASKAANVPDFVKKRTMQIVKQGAAHGITPEGAYKLAMADYGEMVVNGQIPSPEPANKVATRKAAAVPHTELGGATRSLVPPKQTKAMSWDEFRAEAEKVLRYSPGDGARAGNYGTAGYNGEPID